MSAPFEIATLEDINTYYKVYLDRERYGDFEESVVGIFNGRREAAPPFQTHATGLFYESGKLENVMGLYYQHALDDLEKAKEYYQKSANKNNHIAIVNLAKLEPTASERVRLLKLAIEKGNSKASILYLLATAMLIRNFERGELATELDKIEAHNTLIKAVQLGDVCSAWVMSALNLDDGNINAAKFYCNLALMLIEHKKEEIKKEYNIEMVVENINDQLKEIQTKEDFMVQYHGYVPPVNPTPVFMYNGIIDLSNIEESLASTDRY